MLNAWLIGVGILAVAYLVWFFALLAKLFSGSLVILLWLAPFIAALISSYLGPSKKVLLGISMAIPTAIFAIAFNAGYQLLGNAVDFPGLKGTLILFVVTVIYGGILSLIGGVIGYFLSKQRSKGMSTG